MSEWKTRNAALFEAFLAADPDAAEPIRRAHCPVCRQTAEDGSSAFVRGQVCERWRCGLRDPERFRLEQEWAAATLHLFADPATSDDEALANLNHHLAVAGCVTIGIAGGSQGGLTLGINAATLRGELHAAIVGWIVALAGSTPRDLAEMTIAGAQSAIRGQRESRIDWAKRRAAALRAEGLSDKKIAQRLKVDPKSIRNWLGNREGG